MTRPIKLTDELIAQVKRLVEGLDEFPEDAWYEITENIDLNLYRYCDEHRATLYRIDNGNTNTLSGFVDITQKVLG